MGRGAAMCVCMDRIFPRGKHRRVCFERRPVANAADAIAAMSDIVQAVADGDLTAPEAAEMSKLVRNVSEAAINASCDARVTALETRDEKKEIERLRRPAW